MEALALRGPDVELVLACAQVEAQLGRHADARARLHAAYEQSPSAALAFELATSAMLHGHGDELHEWAERAARDAHDDPMLRAGAAALRAHAAALTAPPRPDDAAVAAPARPDDAAVAALARLGNAGLPAPVRRDGAAVAVPARLAGAAVAAPARLHDAGLPAAARPRCAAR